jgi:hypothetical protein
MLLVLEADTVQPPDLLLKLHLLMLNLVDVVR